MNGDKPSAEIRGLVRSTRMINIICHSRAAREAVGERSYCSEVHPVREDGAVGSENVGMSSESPVRIWTAKSPRFPSQRFSGTG